MDLFDTIVQGWIAYVILLTSLGWFAFVLPKEPDLDISDWRDIGRFVVVILMSLESLLFGALALRCLLM